VAVAAKLGFRVVGGGRLPLAIEEVRGRSSTDDGWRAGLEGGGGACREEEGPLGGNGGGGCREEEHDANITRKRRTTGLRTPPIAWSVA
jgi:hypothetical protein